MAIKSYVKIRPIKEDGAYSASFNQIRKGINRTGKVVTNISRNQVETEKLITFERDWLRTKSFKEVDEDQREEKEDLNVFQKWKKGFMGMFKFEQRNKKEDKAESKGTKGQEESPIKKKAKKAAMGFLQTLANFLTPIFDLILKATVFKWLENPENAKKAAKVFKLVTAIGKFAFSILGFGVNNIARGITNIFGADPNKTGIAKVLAPLTGFLQLLTGIATLRYLLNPLKLFSDGKKVRNLFRDTSLKELEWKKNEQWRKFGYKDTESGKIYTEQEYKSMKKSVERQQKKLRAQGKTQQADRIGRKFNQRVKNPTRLQSGKNFGKKLMKPGMQKGLAVVGGISRIASGIAMGEDKTQAVGAGLGQAAGGMIGAAAGTALLGPFLGPFAPIVGNAIGGFLGEWVGKTFLPVIKPLFEPIKKYFQLMFGLVQDVAKDTGITEFLGTLFEFVGQIGKVMFDVLGWIMKPITFLLGGVIKLLGGTISFIIKAAKNIWAFMSNPIGFAWKVIRGKDPGKDVKLDEMAAGGRIDVQGIGDGSQGKLKIFNKDGKQVGKVYNVMSGLSGKGNVSQADRMNTSGAGYPMPDGNYRLHGFEQHGPLGGNLRGLGDWSAYIGPGSGNIGARKGLMLHQDIDPFGTLGCIGVALGGRANTLQDKEFVKSYKTANPERIKINLGKSFTPGVASAKAPAPTEDNKPPAVQPKKIAPAPGNARKPQAYNTPSFSDQDMRSKIQAQVAKQQEQHNALQWKKEKDATVQDIVLPPRTVIQKVTVPQINTIMTGTRVKPVRKVADPMFVC